MATATASATAAERATWSGARLGPRLEALRSEIVRRKGSFVASPNPFERDVALFRVPRDLAVVQVRARLLLELVALASVDVGDGWLLAGEHLPHRFGTEAEENRGRGQELVALGLEPGRLPELEERVRSWQRRAESLSFAGPLDPVSQRGRGDWARPDVYLAGGWVENHCIRDYAKVLRSGFGGIPFFFNDRCFIPALAERGIAEADARNYAPIGCIELTVPGRANPHAVSGWINAARCLELALFDGCDPATGERLGPETGLLTELGSYEELERAYRLQVEHFARAMVLGINRGELAQREKGPLPCWSVLTDDCIARGRDVTNGGALYFYHSVCFLGTANTADSLAAVRKLVYREGRVDAGELLEALRTDFSGREPLRQLLLHGAPKYGNDVDEVDSIAVRIANHFIDLMDTFRSPQGGRFLVHLFSFLQNVGFGRCLGATPDGRRRGEPVAYSVSAQQGRDEKGVTALLRSIAKLPHHRAAGGTAAMVDLDPSFVTGERGVERLAELVLGAMEMGVGQLQWNVVSVERLERARRDPETWGNIPVRVAGYSQLFRLLDAELQDHVIARTKHRG